MAQGEFFRKLLVGDIFHFCRFAPHRRDIQLFAAVEVAPVAAGSARESASTILYFPGSQSQVAYAYFSLHRCLFKNSLLL
jgi:hypothetical protein